MTTANRETLLGQVQGRQLFDKIRITVFNEFGINVGGYAVSNRDTEFTYQLQTEDKLTKPRLAQLQAFIAGVVACYKSF